MDLNNNTELAPAEDDPEETPPQYLPSFKIEVSKPQVIVMTNAAVMLLSFKTIISKKGKL